MRVTQSLLSTLATSSMRNTRTRLLDAQETAISGMRVNEASDDPAAASRARLTRSLLAESDAYKKNIDFGTLRVERAEQALAESSNVLVRVKELGLAMANGSINGSQRDLASAEISDLRDNLIDLANTQLGGEYVFAHINTTSAVVDSSGNFTYDVNTYQSVREVEIGPAERGEIGASGSHAFAQRASDANSVDVFTVLDDMIAALNADDGDLIRVQVDNVDTAHSQVITERTRVGLRYSRLQNAASSVADAKRVYQSLESNLVDADAAEAFSALNLAETGLQATIAVTGRLLGPSLLDSLR